METGTDLPEVDVEHHTPNCAAVVSTTVSAVGARQPVSATIRLTTSIIAAGAAGLAVSIATNVPLGIVFGIAVGEAWFVVSGWFVLWPLDAAATRANAAREDLRLVLEELAVVIVTLGGLASTVVLLIRTDYGAIHASVTLAAVTLAWAALHLMYAARYAAL